MLLLTNFKTVPPGLQSCRKCKQFCSVCSISNIRKLKRILRQCWSTRRVNMPCQQDLHSDPKIRNSIGKLLEKTNTLECTKGFPYIDENAQRFMKISWISFLVGFIIERNLMWQLSVNLMSWVEYNSAVILDFLLFSVWIRI